MKKTTAVLMAVFLMLCSLPAGADAVRPAGPAITCGNPGYWLVNSRLTFEHGNYAVSAWVKNLTNSHDFVRGVDFGALAYAGSYYADPRTYGVTVGIKF